MDPRIAHLHRSAIARSITLDGFPPDTGRANVAARFSHEYDRINRMDDNSMRISVTASQLRASRLQGDGPEADGPEGDGPEAGRLRLGHLVGVIAARPASWRDIVRFDASRRWYHRLELTDDYEVWLLSWLPGQSTGFHDHGGAAGAFAVAQGELRERMVPAGQVRASGRTLPAGQVRTFGAGHVHDVVNVWTEPAVSVHAYSPPLTVMRRYELTAGGLFRSAIEYSELNW
jgi:mannose-6-phosphate isomerase-like protein (cupin superfamily)